MQIISAHFLWNIQVARTVISFVFTFLFESFLGGFYKLPALIISKNAL